MMAFLQNAFLIVVPFLIVITLIVTVHELGHFLTARVFGVAIDRFSVGFGRALASRRDRAGVEWRIGWLPLGGYVRFAGDENAASLPDRQDLADLRARIVSDEGVGAERKYLHFKPLWQRALIVAAGPAANFLLAVFLFSTIYAVVGSPVMPFSVGAVAPGSVAERSGFKPGDRILKADGRALAGFEDLVQYVKPRAGVAIDFEVQRGATTLRILAAPSSQPERVPFLGSQSVGQLGIIARQEGAWRYVRPNPLAAVGMGADQTWQVLDTTVLYLGRMITGQASLNQLHGFVGIAQVTGAITKQAIDQAPHDPGEQWLGVAVNLASLAALISVSIGFMNLLPIPVLDGGHLVFYAYELIARRPLSARVQAASYRVGLALLVGLMLFANLHDLPILRVFHFFGSLFS